MAHLLYQILTGYCKARIIQILWYWLRDRENNVGMVILEILLVKVNIYIYIYLISIKYIYTHIYTSNMLLPSRFSRVQLCATPWTAAYQAPPSMGFSGQQYWSGVPFSSPTTYDIYIYIYIYIYI